MEAQLTDVDKLYFPHEWQKRLPFDKILEEHVKFFVNETEKVRKTVRCEFDIPYGVLTREKYDIYGIDLPDESPIVIHIHGGYWQVKEISHSNQGFLAKVLHNHGIKLMAVGYELCPDVTLKEILEEIEVGVKRCLDYAKRCKAKTVYLSGHSVGAHMVAYLFTNLIPSLPLDNQQLIRAAFLTCGLYDLTPLTKTIINQGLKLTEELARELSPQFLTITCPGHIKMYVIVAENESPAFLEQAEVFYKKLQDGNVNVEFRKVLGVDHFNIAEKMTEEEFEMTQVYLKEIKGV